MSAILFSDDPSQGAGVIAPPKKKTRQAQADGIAPRRSSNPSGMISVSKGNMMDMGKNDPGWYDKSSGERTKIMSDEKEKRDRAQDNERKVTPGAVR